MNFDRSAAGGGQRARAVPEGGASDAKPESERVASPNDEVVALANFLRERVNETMRSSPLFTVGDIVVGDAKAGEAYFNGDGGCATCHNATTRNLAGIATRIPAPVDLQQRMLFPGGGRGRGGRGALAARRPPGRRTVPVNPNAITVTIASPSGPTISGVLVEESDFYITVRESDGTVRAVRRTPAHEDHEERSPAGAHRPARSPHRQADSRSGRLPGDAEMRALVHLAAAVVLSAALAAQQPAPAQQPRRRSRRAAPRPARRAA